MSIRERMRALRRGPVSQTVERAAEVPTDSFYGFFTTVEHTRDGYSQRLSPKAMERAIETMRQYAAEPRPAFLPPELVRNVIDSSMTRRQMTRRQMATFADALREPGETDVELVARLRGLATGKVK